MDFSMYEIEHVYPNSFRKRERIADFLRKSGLEYEHDLEFTVVLKYYDEIVATGSISGNVLKCIAVAKTHENQGLAAKVVTELIQHAHEHARYHLFIFTKPENKGVFEELGFYEIGHAEPEAILLENYKEGLKNFLKSLAIPLESGCEKLVIGSIVANCNPFTLGHLHLFEYALRNCDILHVFILAEDKSEIPAEIRYRLVKEGTSHLKNIYIHKGSDYIISAATFPTYFLKSRDQGVSIHARLDLNIFCNEIVPFLQIQKRFVGEEPLCYTTAIYNAEMAKILPQHGVELVVIPRLAIEGLGVISASLVRKLFKEGNFNVIKKMVPESTYEYLCSCETKDLGGNKNGNDNGIV